MKKVGYRFLAILILFLNISFIVFGGKPFTFVQLTDTQLGFGDYQADLKSFEQAVKQINALNPDFVIICGDLVNVPNDTTYADFKRIQKKLKVPCYCVAGNHDVKQLPNDTSLTYYRRVIGKDYYRLKHKGYWFVVANTQLWNGEVKNESEKHDRWFRETLERAGRKKIPVFVAGHSPIYVAEPDEKPEYFNFPTEKRKEVLALLTENNVIAYLSGHAHKLILNNYKGIQLVTSETTSRNFDKRPPGFRLWQVSDGSATHQFVPLEL